MKKTFSEPTVLIKMLNGLLLTASVEAVDSESEDPDFTPWVK